MSDQAPERWKSICLKHFAKARRGTTYIASELSENSISYPLYINMKSFRVGGGYNVNGDKFYTSPYAQTQLVKANDLLIANTDVTASCDILGAPICLPKKKLKKGVLFSHHVTALSLSKGINKFFLFYLFCLDANRVKMQSYGRGTTVKMLDSKEFSNLLLLIPPLPEQKKIASILASVDEVIENTQKQVDKLQDLKKATMNDLLTKGIGHTEFKDSELGRIPKRWEVKRLGDVSKIYFSNVDKKSYINEIPVFLCNYMDVYNNSCIKNGIEFMRATAKQREIDKFLLLKDDVIITKDSETPDDIAVSAYVSEHLKNVLCGYHLALIRSDKKKLSGLYLAHLFELDDIQHRYYQLANGSTRFGLTSDAVLESSIPVPPLREQKKIASILTSMDTQIQERERKLEQTQSLKKSLMQDLLAGKVRVKVN